MNKLDDFLMDALVGKSEKTIKTYRFQIEKFNAYLITLGTSIDAPLTRVDVQQYITHLTDSGHKASSINIAFNSIRSYAKWSNQLNVVQNVRVVKRTPILQRTPKSLERNERNRLLRLVEQKRSVRDVAIVTTLLYCGLRLSELIQLNVKDVDLKRGGVVHVNRGKGDKERIVPVTAEVRNRLEEYLALREDIAGDTPLFLSNRHQRISPRTVEHMLKQLGDEYHPHRLRHTFVRGLLDQGVDLVTVAKLAGHSDLNVTRSYATPSLENMVDAMDHLYVD